MKLYGIDLDIEGRCIHYNNFSDIVCLKCGQCHKYYACYKCHNALESHSFLPININDNSPIICGKCRNILSYKKYEIGNCCYCQHPFNLKCKKHSSIYFSK